MRRIADDVSLGWSLEAQLLNVPAASANDARGCASSSKRTTPSCARLQSCTVALREAEKLGAMGDVNFGFERVKNDVCRDVGLFGAGLRRFTAVPPSRGGGALCRVARSRFERGGSSPAL
jgi:hypothetical protein